ncbi:MAG TPA: twin-arginine translocase TatA/TatE family subunit [Anaerolineaceae bacterium]|jgi:sec-independent protein translocase protein TatA
MPFGLQPVHLIVVAIVALVVFGPKNLPEIGRGVGKALKEFRLGAREMTESFRTEVQPDAPAQARPVQPVQMLAQPQTSVPPMGGSFCTHCGTANPLEAKFCNRCGSPMAAAPAPVEAPIPGEGKE